MTGLSSYSLTVIKGLHLLKFLMPPVYVFDRRRNSFGKPSFYLEQCVLFLCAHSFLPSR